MGVGDILESVFGGVLPDHIEISDINLLKIDGGNKYHKNGPTLNVNVAELEPDERQQFLKEIRSEFGEEGRILRDEESEDVLAIEENYQSEYQEYAAHFENHLSDRYIAMISDSMYLRSLIDGKELTKEEILERKRDIASRHGSEAFYVSSLATAGYFDPNGGLQDLLVDMRLNEDYKVYNFQEEFQELVDKKLLCLFVENDDDVYEATQDLERRIVEYQRMDPVQDWIDIRGIGPRCEEIIEGIVQNLEEEYFGIDYDRWRKDGNLVIRVYPHSIEDLT